jgi:hypothetical protein
MTCSDVKVRANIDASSGNKGVKRDELSRGKFMCTTGWVPQDFIEPDVRLGDECLPQTVASECKGSSSSYGCTTPKMKIQRKVCHSQRFAHFHHPVISLNGRDMLTNSDVHGETAGIFFPMALNENGFLLIPSGPSPEHARLRRGLSVLARRFGFTGLTVELV